MFNMAKRQKYLEKKIFFAVFYYILLKRLYEFIEILKPKSSDQWTSDT